jgi:Uncharacterized protein encoded in hypervariable junctions of pilus gene clusters
MKNVLKYKEYIGTVNFSADDNVFFGKLEGINDLITFEGSSVQELNDAFCYMVDEHIKDCEAENIQAEKSHKGSFNIRLSPELHRRAAIFAKLHGISLNTFVKESIESKLDCVQ